MEWIFHIALVLILVIAFYQDWKYRAISWLVFPVLLSVAFVLFWLSQLALNTVVFNIVFLTVIIGSLFLYVSVKRRRWVNIFKADLGLGDVLFLVAICPLFSERNYILFFITGMLFSGLIHLFVFAWNKEVKIPLAGYLAGYIILSKGYDLCVDTNLFYTTIIG